MENTIKLFNLFNKKDNKKGLSLAEVKSENPLVVIFKGIEWDKNEILIADFLKENYQRKYEIKSDSKTSVKGNKFSLSASPSVIIDTIPGGTRPIVTIPEGQTTSVELEGVLETKGDFKFTDTLKKGDILAGILTEDEQVLILLVKLVSA